VYVPAAKLETKLVVAAPALFHKYVYGDVPPVTDTATAPVEFVRQTIWVVPEMLAASKAGCVMAYDAVSVQRFASVTVTEYVPSPRLLSDDVVAPVLHRYVYGEAPPPGVTDAEPLPAL
jgi:hypothetical protein